MRKLVNHLMYLVEWEDSSQPTPSWQWLHDVKARRPVRVRTIGWRIASDENSIALAVSLSDPDEDNDQQVSGVVRIPLRCIIRERILAPMGGDMTDEEIEYAKKTSFMVARGPEE